MNILGYFHGIDPAAAIVRDGEVVAYVEEERLIRFKHAANMFPARAIRSCLEIARLSFSDIDCVVWGLDAPRYANGDMATFFERINERYPPDEKTIEWQTRNQIVLGPNHLEAVLRKQLVQAFGVTPDQVPALHFYPHHRTHAAAAFYLSPFEEALVMSVDGSGDSECTSLWHGRGTDLTLLERIEIPHSLGWFYAAMTEYLGFKAYDGEYKVMGLAAYGRNNLEVREKISRIVHPGERGWDYEVEPSYLHHGGHTYSDRFTDELVELMNLPARHGSGAIEPIHEDIAFETQRVLEESVIRLLTHFRSETGLSHLAITGGVGLNVKMNSRLQRMGLFDEVFPFPIPNDSGLAFSAPLGFWVEKTGKRPKPLSHVYWGPQFSDEDIEEQISSCGIAYEKCNDIADAAAGLIESGKIVGWFQGALEGGPRALGGRSILADPRDPASRDRINSAIKFREYWRPFCPSLLEEAVGDFMEEGCAAPYMILAFKATKRATEEIPAVVHVDGTMRPQTVNSQANPRFHALIEAFRRRTGVPVVLNTSFNIKGEAIVCTPRDALRTFWSTGIDALAIGSFLVVKPEDPSKQL
jgi:carbamoyltransferase